MMYQMPVMVAKQYRDRVFRAVFAEKKDLLELYNALRGSDYRDLEELEITTLEHAVYLGMKNDLTMAVELAIDECIRNGVLQEFLRKNRAEVVDMLLYEYDEEKHITSEKALSYAEGKEAGEEAGLMRGKAESILELLEELGQVPEELRRTVMEENSLAVLTCWFRLAMKAKTLEEFERGRREIHGIGKESL